MFICTVVSLTIFYSGTFVAIVFVQKRGDKIVKQNQTPLIWNDLKFGTDILHRDTVFDFFVECDAPNLWGHICICFLDI